MTDIIVIGAGCSVPYGFPSGIDLYNAIRNFKSNFERDEVWRSKDNVLFELFPENEFRYCDYTEERNGIRGVPFLLDKKDEVVDPFFKAISASVMVSIDEFLKNKIGRNNEKVIDFGKRLIAYLILETEKISSINRPDLRGDDNRYGRLYEIDWIQHLLSKIDQAFKHNETTKKIDFLKSIKFLSFNYDRVLEMQIYNYLTCDLEISEHESIGIIDSLIDDKNIIHVNGYIGKLSETPFGGTKSEISRNRYDEISQKMKTVWEMINNEDRKDKMMEFMTIFNNARRMYFLGFSYLKQNLESISLTDEAPIAGRQCYGTAYGMSEPMKNSIANRLHIARKYILNCTAKDLIIDYYTPITT